MNPDDTAGPEATLERMLASHLVAPVLSDAFDRSVLARLDQQLLRGQVVSVELLARAECDRVAALAGLAARLRRGFGAALLDLAGFAALAWTASELAPHLAELTARFSPALPVAGSVGMPAVVVVLALATGYLIARERRLV